MNNCRLGENILVNKVLNFVPKISVIIPVYNSEKYLQKCLDSVINQTLKDIEIICVDDGSTDNSLNILKKYAQNDDRIRIIKQKNQFAGVARNNGLKIAQGKYVHFLDSDDWLVLNAYQKMYDLIEEKNVNVLKFRAHAYDDKLRAIKSDNYTDLPYMEQYFDSYITDFELFKHIMDSPWSGIYNRKFINENNIYFDDLKCANDVGFYYRCLVKAKKIYFSSEKFLYYRKNIDKSLMGTRYKNFDCVISLFDIISKITADLDDSDKKSMQNFILSSILNFYVSFIDSKNCSFLSKLKIKSQMKKFLKKLPIKIVNDNNKNRINTIETDFNIVKHLKKNLVKFLKKL